MEKRGLHLGVYILFLLVIITAVMLLKFHPALTGGVVYEPTILSKNWTFDSPADYSYDPTLIEVANHQAKLTSTNIIIYWNTISKTIYSLENAIYNGNDVTSKVNALDSQKLEINHHLFDFFFPTPLQNGDTISFYLSDGEEGIIYFCNNGTTCTAPGYGSLIYDGEEGWFNLTLSEQPSPNFGFSLNAPKIKLNYLFATHELTEQHQLINTTYPFSAEISTNDFSPAEWQQWDRFTTEEELFGQSINYSYSTDQGNTWTTTTENNNLSTVQSNKIRFKAKINSNGSITPLLKSISIKYRQKNTSENWTAYYGECRINDTKIKYYLEENQVGSALELPADNGTEVACDYCTPQWREVNNSCRMGNFFIINYQDQNECYKYTQLDSDNQKLNQSYGVCNYCSSYNCSGSAENSISLTPELPQTVEIKVAAKNWAKLEIKSQNHLENVSLDLIAYDHNLKKENANLTSADRFLEINSSTSNFSTVKITLYYTDEEIALQKINEDTLKMYYYNETSQSWEVLNSVVNSTENYVSASVSHLSFYGLFGEKETSEEETSLPSSPGGSSSSGGGGGGGGRTSSTKNEEAVKPLTKEEPTNTYLLDGKKLTLELPSTEKTCQYTLEINLPEDISLVENPQFEGEIINKGNCIVPRMQLQIDSSLADDLEINGISLEPLKPGDSVPFVLIRKAEKKNENKWLNSLNSAAILETTFLDTISGKVMLEGYNEKEEKIFQRELPVKVTIQRTSTKIDKKIFWAVPLVTVIILGILLLGKKRKKEKKK